MLSGGMTLLHAILSSLIWNYLVCQLLFCCSGIVSEKTDSELFFVDKDAVASDNTSAKGLL